jgi:hypothetical protein
MLTGSLEEETGSWAFGVILLQFISAKKELTPESQLFLEF